MHAAARECWSSPVPFSGRRGPRPPQRLRQLFDQAGRRPIEKLFTRRQEKFLGALAGDRIEFNELNVLGPLQAHRWQFADPACPWPMTAELWKRADGARLMELSIKAPVVQAAVAIAGFMAHLAEIGAERDLAQQTKTRWALEFYAERLRAGEAAAAAG